MQIPDELAAHTPLDNHGYNETDLEGLLPELAYRKLRSWATEIDLCQQAMSTGKNPTSGRPMKRGDKPRYQMRQEEHQSKVNELLFHYSKVYGEEAAAQIADLSGTYFGSAGEGVRVPKEPVSTSTSTLPSQPTIPVKESWERI